MLRLAARVFGVPLRSVTPQLRRAVFARDGHRCAVPGCRNFRFLHLHHPNEQAKGGPTEIKNLITLCSARHRAIHEGTLAVEGNAIDGYVVRHANGTLYGGARSRPVGPTRVQRPDTEKVVRRGGEPVY